MSELLMGWWSLLLLLTSCMKLSCAQSNTVQLQHGGNNINNNSVFVMTEVGDPAASGTPLLCATQLTLCCADAPSRRGNWYFPNGTEVPVVEAGYSFYRTRRNAAEGGVLGGVLLNRRFDATSPNGIYHCIIPGADGDDQTLYIGLYAIAVNISDGGAIPALGESFELTCSVSGADGLNISYQWTESGAIISGETSSALSFPALTLADVGSYMCEVTISSTTLDGGIATVASSHLNVSVPVPVPTVSLVVTPSPDTIFLGSTPTLTCTVQFNMATVNILLTVITFWVRPDGNPPVRGGIITVVNSSTYRDFLGFDSATPSDAGIYTCIANVSSQSVYITGTQSAQTSTNISILPFLPPPINLTVTETTATSISLNWTKIEGATVSRYEISYTFTINGCPELGTLSGGPINLDNPITVYTLTDSSSSNPIEEDSVYNISIKAINFAATSEAVSITATTPTAAPSGPPLNIRNTSISSTSVTMQWDEVECRERNGVISSYQGMFSRMGRSSISFISPVRMLTTGALLPRSTYIVNVNAVGGPAGTVTIETPTAEAAVQLQHGGNNINNNSVFVMTEVGDPAVSGTPLLCATQLTPCCADVPSRHGNWYYPNGTEVPVVEAGYSFYRTRRNAVQGGVLGGVLLNRRFDATSPNGIYHCIIPGADGDDQTLYIGLYAIAVNISDGGAIPALGESFELTCSVSGADGISYQWTKSGAIISGEISSALSFPTLTLADVGSYMCEVTVSSTTLDGGTARVASSPLNVSVPVPVPTLSLVVTPSPDTIFLGSTPTLTCTVQFNMATVNIPLTVITFWARPDGNPPVRGGIITVVNSSTYRDFLGFDSATTSDAGIYTCIANVSSQSVYIVGAQSAQTSINISILPFLPPPINFMVTETMATSISLNWTKMEGAIVNQYEISYTFTINGCPELGTLSGGPINLDNPITVYTLTDSSSSNPIEEDSVYNISIKAINFDATSEAISITATTPTAAPSGPPLNIRNTSISSTGVTMQWDEVECRERNGVISSYQGLVSSMERNSISFFTSARMFTSALLPRSTYIVNVNAVSGPAGTVAIETPAAGEVGFLLGGSIYANNSVVAIDAISVGSGALYCLTNRLECCRRSDGALAGQWYFPNGTAVGTSADGVSIYRTRGPSEILLNRRNNATMPTGVFRCEIPDASGITQNVYVTVVARLMDVAISTSQFEINSPAQAVCTTTLDGVANIAWLKDGVVVIEGGALTSLDLVFSVVNDSIHGNIYTCRVTLTNGVIHRENITISVDFPSNPISIGIDASEVATAGQTYTLNCTVVKIGGLINAPIVSWTTGGAPVGSGVSVVTTTGPLSTTSVLTFNPLRTSDGGNYMCEGSLTSPARDDPLTVSATRRVDVKILTPSINIILPPGPLYAGAVTRISCTISLDPAIDSPASVFVQWMSGSTETELSNATSRVTISTLSGSQPTFTSVLTLEPLTAADTSFTCLARAQPSGESLFIFVSDRGEESVTVPVQSLPVPVVSIDITSRSGDVCGEAKTLTCTATTVDNVLATPTITWLFGGNPVPSSGNDPVMSSSTGQLVFNDISSSNIGEYTCRAGLTIPEAGIVDLINQTATTVSTDQPDGVQSLKCVGVSASALSLSWERPAQVGSGVAGYRVEVQRLQHTSPGSEDLESVPLVPEYDMEVKEMQAEVNQGLEPEVPYNITVRALNAAGCGPERQLYCFTREGVPPRPEKVLVARLDSTTIVVSWTKLTLVELKGLASYVITYNVVIPTRKRQQFRGMTNVSWTENSVFLSNLQPDAQYDITVSLVTSTGTSVVETRSDVNQDTPSSDNTAAIIGAVVAILIVLILVVAASVIIIYVLKHHRTDFKLLQRNRAQDQPEGIVLSNIMSHANKSDDFGFEEDHDYEAIDKYRSVSQPYEVPQVTRPKLPLPLPPDETASSTGDYEFTQCSAYVPVTHGNHDPSSNYDITQCSAYVPVTHGNQEVKTSTADSNSRSPVKGSENATPAVYEMDDSEPIVYSEYVPISPSNQEVTTSAANSNHPAKGSEKATPAVYEMDDSEPIVYSEYVPISSGNQEVKTSEHSVADSNSPVKEDATAGMYEMDD